jgi:hypothetical protein
MKYPIFDLGDFSYVFLPDIPITEFILDQLQEMWDLYSNNKPFYIFVKNHGCYVFSDHEINVSTIPMRTELPNTYRLVKFTSYDDSEHEMSIRQTKDVFRNEMVSLLQSMKQYEIILVVVGQP